MSLLALTSSTSIASLSNHSSFQALTFSNNTQQYCRMTQLEFQPVTKSLGYVLGEQLSQLGLIRGAMKVASFVFSKLPSFSLPAAAASAAVECTPSICPIPTGSYEDSCQRPVMNYISSTNQCELKTRCATIYEGLPHQQTSFLFSPSDSGIVLGNHNGTLVVQQRSREDTINLRLGRLSETALTSEFSEKEQALIIGTLNAGDVITVNKDMYPTLVSSEKWKKEDEAFSAFQRIAKATGGIMGYSPSADSLKPLMEKMSAHILKTAESSEFLDIAFVLDTTQSMEKYIDQVKNNLVQFLQHLQEKKKDKASTCRVALIEYRDTDDKTFLNKINTDFTSNLNQVQSAVRGLATLGGGDTPEAVLDALFVAKDLSWNAKAKRIVILIGDAPPHPTTVDGIHDEAAVIAQYQSTGTQIAVYPVVAQIK